MAAVVVQRQLAIPPFHARTGTHEPAHPLRTHPLDYLLEFFPQATHRLLHLLLTLLTL